MGAWILALIALLWLPGFLVGVASGLRLWWALAAAPALTFAAAGLTSWLFGAIGAQPPSGPDTGSSAAISFNLATFSTAVVLYVLVVGTVRFVFWRRGRSKLEPSQASEEVNEERRRFFSTAALRRFAVGLPAAAGVTAASATLLWFILPRIDEVRGKEGFPGGLEVIPQSWDVHWHGSVVRAISDFGVASATRMGEIQNVETLAESYYPTAWHSVAALVGQVTGLSAVATTNLMGLAAPALVVPLGAALLAYRMVLTRPRGDWQLQWVASVAAGVAAMATVTLPVLVPIGIFVGAWPYQIAIALVGVTFALTTAAVDQPRYILASILAIIGIGQLHPAAVPALVLLLAIWWLFDRLFYRRRFRDVGLLLAIGVPALVALLPQWLSGAEQEDDIREVTAEIDADRAETWWRAFHMLTRHAEDNPAMMLIIYSGLAGMILLTVGLPLFTRARRALPQWPRTIWPLIAFGISLVFTTHALTHFETWFGDIASMYTDLHYSTPHRLVQATANLYAAGVGVLVALVVQWLSGVIIGRAKAATAVTVAAGIAASFGLFQYAIPRVTPYYDWSIISTRDTAVISAIADEDRVAFRWLSQQPEVRGSRVFTNPAEGSGWMYTTDRVDTVFRHFDWPVADEYTQTSLLFWHADKLGRGELGEPDAVNLVDQAAEDLGVKFIYISPPNLLAEEDPHPVMEEFLWFTPGVTPVYRDRTVTIFAIRRAVDEETIERMREESPEPVPEYEPW